MSKMRFYDLLNRVRCFLGQSLISLTLPISAVIPTHYFSIHQSAVRTVRWIKEPAVSADGHPDFSGDPLIIASGGYDGCEIFTDIRDGIGNIANRTRGVQVIYRNIRNVLRSFKMLSVQWHTLHTQLVLFLSITIMILKYIVSARVCLAKDTCFSILGVQYGYVADSLLFILLNVITVYTCIRFSSSACCWLCRWYLHDNKYS